MNSNSLNPKADVILSWTSNYERLVQSKRLWTDFVDSARDANIELMTTPDNQSIRYDRVDLKLDPNMMATALR